MFESYLRHEHRLQQPATANNLSEPPHGLPEQNFASNKYRSLIENCGGQAIVRIARVRATPYLMRNRVCAHGITTSVFSMSSDGCAT